MNKPHEDFDRTDQVFDLDYHELSGAFWRGERCVIVIVQCEPGQEDEKFNRLAQRARFAFIQMENIRNLVAV